MKLELTDDTRTSLQNAIDDYARLLASDDLPEGLRAMIMVNMEPFMAMARNVLYLDDYIRLINMVKPLNG